jgi:isoleucyl-tRNA synthetase
MGNVIAPQKVSDTLGAEVLRLWVAATDYSGELSISDEILKRVVEGYRRIRNTLRFLLANTADFDPVAHALPQEDWLEIDRYALALAKSLQRDMMRDYDHYDFHFVAQKLQAFCSEDLGGFYLDILKDRLYTAGKDSKARRSAQNALYQILQRLVRLMAPILSFTAEEIWTVTGGARDQADKDGADRDVADRDDSVSVFTHTWDEFPAAGESQELLDRWGKIRSVRAEVQKQLEEARVAGKIGSSLQAEVRICASGEKLALLQSLQDDLRFVLITSSATLTPVSTAAGEAVIVSASAHAKCERCWHYRDDVGADAAHPGLCGRCVSNLHGAGEPRTHA